MYPYELYTLALVLIAHTYADFIGQSRWMAENKSKSLIALFAHILQYGAALSLIFMAFLPIINSHVLYETPVENVIRFLVANIAAHGLTDLITSKLSSRFYRNNKIELFWAVIGIDQLAHLLVFAVTLDRFIW